jgi:hypothetical protein
MCFAVRTYWPAAKTAITWGAQVASDQNAPQSFSSFDDSLRGWTATSSTAIVSRIQLYHRNHKLDRDGIVCIFDIVESPFFQFLQFAVNRIRDAT